MARLHVLGFFLLNFEQESHALRAGFCAQDMPGKKIDFSKKFQIAPKMLGSCWA
jgi:hypothetical protein